MPLTITRLFLAVLATGLFPHFASAQHPMPPASFVEETKSSGLESVYAGEWQYMVGGGVAVFDCDGDFYPDLFLAGGEKPAKFYRNAADRGGPLRFEAQASGLELDKVTGAYPVDVDGDGKIDLVLLRVGENAVMRGLGNCRFERANEAWGFDGGDGWTTAFAATWEKGALWPTFAVGNYIDRLEETSPWGSCTNNWLHRPATTDGKTQQKFAEPLPLVPSYCPLSMLFTDWNRSGTPGLRISNDREYYEGGQEQLWRIEPGKPPKLYTEAEGWKYLRIWGMGISGYDIDFDGYPEYALTSMADNRLQKLVAVPENGGPKPSYKDIAFAKGATAHRPYTGGELHPSTAWHVEFADVNNDGRVDLFMAKGNVDEMPDFAIKDPNNLLLQASDGKFHEAGDRAGVASLKTSRGATLADFNLDGLLDLVVVNRRENAQVWRNTTRDAGHWVQIGLRQEGSNRDAIGSWVEVSLGSKIIRREVTIGGGHVSGQLGWIHMGVGEEKDVKIRVQWPDGEWSAEYSVKSDEFVILERGKREAEYWSPTR